jgi:integrase
MPIAHLTDVVVLRLTNPGTYFDKSTPAFGLRVGKNRKTWIVIRGRERVRTTVGHYPALSLADARKEAKKLLTETPAKNSRLTFGEAYEIFKAEHSAKKKPRTQRDYKRLLEKFFLPAFGHKKLADNTYENITAQVKSVPPVEQAHALAVARTFFRWCVRPPRRYIEHNPLEGLQLPKANRRKRILDAEEIKTVWAAAVAQDYPHGTIVQLLILTGQRKMEIANLRRSWINEKERTITLPEWVAKNSKEHCFPYNGLVAEILETIPRRNSTDLLFPSKVSDDRPISGWSKFKHELADGVSGWQLHDLRRTYRSLHGQIGTHREIAERLINHAAGVMTDVEEIYDRYTYMPEMRAAIEKYETHIRQLTAP